MARVGRDGRDERMTTPIIITGCKLVEYFDLTR